MSVLRKTARRSVGRTTKAAAVAAFGIAIALGTSACGAGQISQTASMEPDVNGTLANIGQLQLRNVQILYPTSRASEIFGNGGPFELAFVINNTDPVNADKLTGITAPEGTVSIVQSADGTDIPAGQALRAGQPAGLLVPEGAQDAADQQRITVELSNAGKTVAEGLTTPLTFHFERAGSITVRTPVVVSPEQPRQDKIREAEAPADQNSGH